jgi:hypothetical protein
MHETSGESINHLLLHFSVARDICYLLFSLYGVIYVMPINVVQLFVCRQRKCSRHKSVKIFNAIPFYNTMWTTS